MRPTTVVSSTNFTVVGGSPWDAVVSHYSEEQGAQDTDLRGACAEGDDTGGIMTDPH